MAWTLQSLNAHLASKTYLDGAGPSGDDVLALAQVAPGGVSAIDMNSHPHAARWARHITHLQKNSVAFAPAAQKVSPVSESGQAAGNVGARFGFVNDQLLEKLGALGVTPIDDPAGGAKNAQGRLQGHSTHNWFVNDKKNKEKRYLVTVRQSSTIDLKEVAALLKAKELRMCAEAEELLGSKKGCLTPISLAYDTDVKVQWVVDSQLLESQSPLRLGTSELDVLPGTVADISISTLEALLKQSGHWEAKTTIEVTHGEAEPKAEAKKQDDDKPKKAKGEAKPKADAKKKGDKKDDNKEEKPVDAEEERKKKLKKVLKEGGKRGVEIEGAGDMGGLRFFSTSVDEPQGDLDMLVQSVEAMNAPGIPGEEERRGCSGHMGKTVFSAGTDQLAVVAYVPDGELENLSCEEWLKSTLSNFQGKIVSTGKNYCTGVVAADGNNNVFPLKIREPMILDCNNFLRKKGLFPDNDSDDDDEMVFGDDDFPS